MYGDFLVIVVILSSNGINIDAQFVEELAGDGVAGLWSGQGEDANEAGVRSGQIDGGDGGEGLR